MEFTRRSLLASLGLAGLHTLMPLAPTWATSECLFRIAVINDEITQDFEKACQIVAGDFKLQWMEIRSMWDKNVTELNDKEIAEEVKILNRHKPRVTDT